MSKNSLKPESSVLGLVRPATQGGAFSQHFAPGDIAVIDVADVDRSYATYLVALRPSLVLNAKPFLTGRKPALGAQTLLESGIPVVDDCGDDLQELREGEQIEVVGTRVLRDGALIAEGQVLKNSSLGETTAQSDLRTSGRLRAYSMASADLFEREQALIMRGAGLPDLARHFDGNVAVVVSSSLTDSEAAAAKQVLGTNRCVLVAVGAEGVAGCKALRRSPQILVGDPGPDGLRSAERAKAIVLVQRPDALVPGADSLTTNSVPYRFATSSLSEPDVALLLAYYGGATAIMHASAGNSIETLLDTGAAVFNGHLLVQSQIEDKLVSFSAWRALHKPAFAAWYLALLVVVAIAVLIAVVLMTPWGTSLLEGVFTTSPLAQIVQPPLS